MDGGKGRFAPRKVRVWTEESPSEGQGYEFCNKILNSGGSARVCAAGTGWDGTNGTIGFTIC